MNKVLFFINSFGSGGAERVCINLAESYLSQGFEVEFVTLYNNIVYKPNERFKVLNLNIDKDLGRIKKVIKIFASISKVNKFIKNKNYCLISSHLPFSNLITRFTKCGKKSLYVLHSNIENNLPKSKLKFYMKLIKLIFKKNKIITVSNSLENILISKYEFNKDLVSTIYNPVMTEDIKIKKKEEVKQEKPYILFVGRIEKEKRLDRLIMNYYNGNFYEKYDLVVVGDGSLLADIKKIVQKLKIKKNVKFVGWQSNVYKWMNKAKLFVSTSDTEAFPMVLIEALASGCPVVSGKCPHGPAEILIDDLNEYLVEDFKSETAYVETIKKALKKYPNIKNSEIIKKCNVLNITKEYLNRFKD